MKARFIDLQKSRLAKGEISRRQFIRSALASGVGMTGALTLANAAEADARPKGGTLAIALRGHALPFAFGTALTEVQSDGALTGALAESWVSNAEATEWQFRLRGDVRFHSGARMSASDAWATLAAAPTLAEAGLVGGEASADGLLRLIFAASVPDLPLWLSDAALIIRPAEGEACGTGPYRQTGQGEIQAFETWYRGRAQFDALDLHDEGTLDDLAAGRISALVGATADERALAARLGFGETDMSGLLQVLADASLTAPRGSLRDPVVILAKGLARTL